MALPVHFGHWLKQERIEHGASLRTMGEAMGISHELVRLIEGGHPPTFEAVVRAAEFLEVNAWEILAYYQLCDPEVLLTLGAHPIPDQLPTRE